MDGKIILPATLAGAFLIAFLAPAGAAPAISENAASAPSSRSESKLQLAQSDRPKRRRSSKSRRNSETAAKDAGLSGRYAVLREKNSDAGCLLNLMRGGRAQVGPGCSDNGFVIFDPIRWQAAGGKLVLRARAGHRISFSRKPDGTWQRDPAGKRALGLKKY